ELGAWAPLNGDLITATEFYDDTLEESAYWEYAVTAVDESSNESARSLPVLFNPDRWLGSDLVAVNFPNPFRMTSGTQISFRTPDGDGATNVKMSAYDINGRRVKLLYSGPSTGGKTRTVRWDGTDQHGNLLSPGVYFYRLEAGNQTFERKMILLR
ncbi:MAG TPA: T9SS type A sorting domain-containing protein, partial [bacterium]|nr:T9SS type A sorting domain-containing protein [bacterium]